MEKQPGMFKLVGEAIILILPSMFFFCLGIFFALIRWYVAAAFMAVFTFWGLKKVYEAWTMRV